MSEQTAAVIDFETRSPCDIKRYGAWIYSKDPQTEVMCLSYQLPNWDQPKRWHMAHPQYFISETPPPQELFDWIAAGGLVEAHNVFFELSIWLNICVKQKGWPEIELRQWRCTASRANAVAIPRALELACEAMLLGPEFAKDVEGHKLMLKMCRPRKPRKAEREAWAAEHGDEPMPLIWHEDEEDLYKLWAYCDQDVRAEIALGIALPELRGQELQLWQLDLLINFRGLRFDLRLATVALEMATEWKKVLNADMVRITGGAVERGSQRARVMAYIEEHFGIKMDDTTGDTLDKMLLEGPAKYEPDMLRMLEITKQVNRTSTRKWQAMIDYTDPEDGRARDLLMFCGAGTGRWTGKGIQIHNFPRGNSKNGWYITADGIEIGTFDMDLACESIITDNVEWVNALNGDVMECLSSSLRGGIIPADGKVFAVADYSAIEARVVLWLAGAVKALEVFERGEDIYCDMATGIYGYPVNKKDHPEERQFGKQAILGLGFGMGYITFFLTCRKYGIAFSKAQVMSIMKEDYRSCCLWVQKDIDKNRVMTGQDGQKTRGDDGKLQANRPRDRLVENKEDPDECIHELALMKYTVDIYRDRYSEVPELWKKENDAAIYAALHPKETARAPGSKCLWKVTRKFLYCELPSGRMLAYSRPREKERDPNTGKWTGKWKLDHFVKGSETTWGEKRPTLRYMNVMGSGKQADTFTYGGKIVENQTQAVARDVMADAMLAASPEAVRYFTGEADTLKPDLYQICMSIHDELGAEVDENKGSNEEFEELMSRIGPWAKGCPIAAEGSRMIRYRKG
jgi:DNA polymerase